MKFNDLQVPDRRVVRTSETQVRLRSPYNLSVDYVRVEINVPNIMQLGVL